MKTRPIKRKVLTLLLALCVVLSLVPVAVFAEPAAATDTADFTVQKGTAAIALLNQYKTDTADSTWDNATKTLTLRGVKFTTTAQTAVKLPVGTTIVLADGTYNFIQSGDVSINVSGQYNNQTFISALDAAGSLTIQGGTAGTGTLSVYAGKVSNASDGWTFSSGISVYGDFTVKGGRVTAYGGYVEGKDSVFSVGVNMDNNIKNKTLLVTGGSLTAIAGEAYEIEEGGTKRAMFSRGVYLYRGNVTVSGDGKLRAESVEKMADGGVLSNGLYVSSGSLTVANSAEVAVAGAYGAYISGGSLTLSGGRLLAVSTQTESSYGNAIDVEVDKNVADSGNITVTGGTLETSNGKIYVSTYGANENQGVFTITGGSIVNRDQIQGSGLKINMSGGSVQTKGIDVGTLTLSGGTLTIREPVRKSDYSGQLYASPALDVSTLAVSGGTLDAAWDWGEYTPMVLPKDEDYNDVGILVRLPYEFNTATFTGGTTILDTGFAGNTALLIEGTLTIGDGMAETGADSSHRQLGTTPVVIAEATVLPTITGVAVENVKLNYQQSETPQTTAQVAAADREQYDILYESWGKRVKDADDTITTAAYWYSDESYYSDGDSRFTSFEKGGRYQYSVRLQAKDGYIFDSNLTNENVTLNGQALPFGSWVNVLDDGKTCLITYGAELRPGQTVEAIRLDAYIEFDAGDEPRFSTGVGDPFVDTDHQRWDANDGSGYGITSSDFWNNRYNGKLITEFEAEKSYTYSVYFKISDLGMEEGYRFDQNTKLYINGKEITLTPEQINVDDNGETIWFSNVLTMTPTPTVPEQKIDVIEIVGATIAFKDGDKPVFTGKTPKNAPYIYQFECWETKDGAGVNSAKFFDDAYEKHITAFESGETYQYILYFKAEKGYYFTTDTQVKINGTLYDYELVNMDPDYDSTGRLYTFWAYTDLTMTPEGGSAPHDHSYGTAWKYDGTNHWHECACGDKADNAAHTFKWVIDKEATATEKGAKHEECTVCGYKKAAVEIPATGSAGQPDDSGDNDSPKTGDSGRTVLWLSLLTLSAAGAAGAVTCGRRRKHADK